MAIYESVVGSYLEGLCPECPIREDLTRVQLATMEAAMDPMNPDAPARVAAVEADVASNIVLAAIYRSKVGCRGAQIRETPCPCCGSSSVCSAYENVVGGLASSEIEE